MRRFFHLLSLIGLASACGDEPRCGDCLCVEDPPRGGCRSNTDCEEPTSVCDRESGRCVECLVLGDCGHRPGTVCSAGVCVCPGGATWCGPHLCVDTANASAHCGVCERACFGACAAGACVDPWERVSSSGAPGRRLRQVAVWTGTAMVIWGGQVSTAVDDVTNTGGIYDPATFTWTPTSLVGAPNGRGFATAVWTGTRMLVWGGRTSTDLVNDGASFDPTTNTWQPMSMASAPAPRYLHTAVWTGQQMIVYGGGSAGGEQLATGAAYDPLADTWTPIAATPESRLGHSAVWDPVAARMLIYGGFGDDGPNLDVYFPFGTIPGGRAFDPVGNAWSPLAVISQPSPRAGHSAVWTGTAMLLFGGYNGATDLDDGRRWDGSQWTALVGGGPSARREHVAVWLSEPGVMAIVGGINLAGLPGDDGAWSPTRQEWQPIPSALGPRAYHTVIATGDSAIVWGGIGFDNGLVGDGGVYRP